MRPSKISDKPLCARPLYRFNKQSNFSSAAASFNGPFFTLIFRIFLGVKRKKASPAISITPAWRTQISLNYLHLFAPHMKRVVKKNLWNWCAINMKKREFFCVIARRWFFIDDCKAWQKKRKNFAIKTFRVVIIAMRRNKHFRCDLRCNLDDVFLCATFYWASNPSWATFSWIIERSGEW